MPHTIDPEFLAELPDWIGGALPGRDSARAAE